MSQMATQTMTVQYIRNEGWRWLLLFLEDSVRHVSVTPEQGAALDLRAGDVVTFTPEGMAHGTFIAKIDPRTGDPIAPLKSMDIA